MNNISIKQKFLLLISVVTLIYLVAMLALKFSNTDLADNFNHFYDHNYMPVRYLDDIQTEQNSILSNIRALQLGYMIKVPEQVDNSNRLIANSFKHTSVLLNKLEQYYYGDSKLLTDYNQRIKTFHQKAQVFVEEMNNSEDHVATRETYLAFVSSNKSLIDFQDRFIRQAQNQANENRDRAEQSIEQANFIFYSALIIATLLSVSFIIFISNALIKNIKKVSQVAHAMASGNLKVKASISGSDEIAQLGNEMNMTIAKLAEAISEVIHSSETVTDNSKKVLDSTAEMENITTEVTENTTQVVTAIEEMAVTSKEIAENTTQTAHAAENMAGLADEGIKESDIAIGRVNDLVGSLEDSSSAVKRLQIETKNIEGILNVIRGISEQTNLLALNAAIEAARAGEQGRGFAVVADEVRTLAQRSAESVNEIEALLNQIAQVGEESVQKMEQSQSLVIATKAQIASSFDKVRVILGHIDDINAKAQQIATAAEEQSLVAGQISENTHSVQSLTDNSAQLAVASKAYSEQMSQASHHSIEKLRFFNT